MRATMRAAGMIVAALAASAVDARSANTERRYAQGGWVATVRDDRFAGTRTCTLATPRRTMLYQPGAVGLVIRHRDTLDAIYRVDDGPPVRWRDRYPALIAAGVAVDGPGLDDPTGGIVWVPEAEVRGARAVTVRTGVRGWGRRYRLGGLDAMIAATRRLGCNMVNGS